MVGGNGSPKSLLRDDAFALYGPLEPSCYRFTSSLNCFSNWRRAAALIVSSFSVSSVSSMVSGLIVYRFSEAASVDSYNCRNTDGSGGDVVGSPPATITPMWYRVAVVWKQ